MGAAGAAAPWDGLPRRGAQLVGSGSSVGGGVGLLVAVGDGDRVGTLVAVGDGDRVGTLVAAGDGNGCTEDDGGTVSDGNTDEDGEADVAAGAEAVSGPSLLPAAVQPARLSATNANIAGTSQPAPLCLGFTESTPLFQLTT